jgi:hypothetical protein
LFFHRMAFSNLILARGDTLLYFYPYWQAASDALRSGRIPLWNPDLFMGAPFLANSQVGLFYPLNWPFWWLFQAPAAVKASIILHLFIAALGAYLAARRTLHLGKPAALFSAIMFALGGYLTSQVEHVNQLQGLAWIPWFIAVLAQGEGHHRLAGARKRMLAFALLFALQFTAGHAQTSFITIFCLLLWSVATSLIGSRGDPAPKRFWRSRLDWSQLSPMVGPIVTGLLLSAAISAVQLLPSLELSQLSSRQGGLPANEVLSFSLPLPLLNRALLPGYGQPLFTEFTAFVPVTVLVLLVLTGLFLALGASNPAYWILAKLPGFNLFRVPARWLVLYALGVSFLAGIGWQFLWDRWNQNRLSAGQSSDAERKPFFKAVPRLNIAAVLVLSLMAWTLVARPLASSLPELPEAPYDPPARFDTFAWLAELLLVYVLAATSFNSAVSARREWFRPSARLPVALAVSTMVAITVLFLATRNLPYNRLTTPEAYGDLRPSVARLMSLADCGSRPSCAQPPDRLLSLSDIFFDSGDNVEVSAIYQDQISENALYDYLVAIKEKEIISPNFPLTFGLSSVDGFDGGILPLRSYSELMRLVLPNGAITTDGRLREQLGSVPEGRWLDLFNARYLITDKVSDLWRNGVFFDLQHPATLTPNRSVTVGYLPDFEATGLYLIVDGPLPTVSITTKDGSAWELYPVSLGDMLQQVNFPSPAVVTDIAFGLMAGDCSSMSTLVSATLFDRRDDTFRSLVPGEYRLIHSGDVKIYENLDVLPRAFLVHDWKFAPDVSSTVNDMTDSSYDPRTTAVLLGEGIEVSNSAAGTSASSVVIEQYQPERVQIVSESDEVAFLKLTDAFYPGWNAEIDGVSADIRQVDGLFRGVFLEPGAHRIIFEYRPWSVQIGSALSVAGILVWLLLFFRSWAANMRR